MKGQDRDSAWAYPPRDPPGRKPSARKRYADSIGRLAAAIDSASADSGRTEAAEEDRQQELANREDALRDILARLAETPGQTGGDRS